MNGQVDWAGYMMRVEAWKDVPWFSLCLVLGTMSPLPARQDPVRAIR